MPRHALLPIACLLALAWTPPPAAAQEVRRCVDERGVAVYTDRSCDSVQARPREAPPDPVAGASIAGGFAVRGCARRPEQLLDGVRGALESRDVNRLATWYHWTGTGTGAARYLMDDLEEITARPLVTIELVYPGETGVRVSSPQPSSNDGRSAELTLTPVSPASSGPNLPSPTPPTEAVTTPERLRVQQTASAADITAVEAEFRLVRNAGCWWIEL